MHASAAILSSLAVVSALTSVHAQEFPLTTLNEDCSFQGIDSGTPTPTREGAEIAMIVVDFETIEDELQPFSMLSLYSCREHRMLWANWDESGRASSVSSQLRKTPREYASWAAMIKNSSPGQYDETSGFADMGQGACACKRFYGIEHND